jgi:hypothetical protein
MPLQGGKLHPNGWYSRRHKTSEPYRQYRAQQEERARTFWAGIKQRGIEAAERTPAEQLERLDKLFGPNKGAKKERKKLLKRLDK